MALPAISCMCPTYGRPRALLEEAVYSFLQQDYAGEKELLILNDFAPQTIVFTHPAVTVVNLQVRFRTVGEKRNAATALCRHDLIAVWDDDDIYLPHRLSLSAARYDAGRRFFKPREAFTWNRGSLSGPKHNVYHGASMWHRSLFDEVGGYGHMGSGEDQDLERRFRAVAGAEAGCDPLAPEEIFYLYRWAGTGSYHLSGFGRGRDCVAEYARGALERGEIAAGEIALEPHWQADYCRAVKDYLGGT